ncbi:MAG: YidC/Oxa1 family membrane protein insertase [Oscillospiraceae bacterium]|nr:YidC/Oxa1 family membrane protein insertase [Oscillospiraceae bacterium]
MSYLWQYVIVRPFGWVFLHLYYMCGNYGVALILFAVLAKLILFAFQIKGKKSQMRMAMINSKVKQLRKQYAHDQARYSAELQALYKRENVKPMAGCVWSIIPLPVMLALYAVIRRPMTNLMHLTSSQIDVVRQLVLSTGGTITGQSTYEELVLARYVSQDFDFYSSFVPQLINFDFHFLGLDMSLIPQWKFWIYGSFSWQYIGLFLIPILSAVTAYISSRVAMKTNSFVDPTEKPSKKKKEPEKASPDDASKQMLWTMPIISLWIGFVMPAGLGIYWIANNLLMALQEKILGKRLQAKFIEEAKARAAREAAEADRARQLRAERIARRAEELKQQKGKKKPPQKKKKPSEAGLSASASDKGRVGTRPYARGRAYDPDRYADPSAPELPSDTEEP